MEYIMFEIIHRIKSIELKKREVKKVDICGFIALDTNIWPRILIFESNSTHVTPKVCNYFFTI